MSSSKDTLPYVASVNPPRKAKKPRLETDPVALLPSTAAALPRPRPQLLPKDSDITLRRNQDSPEHDSSDDEEDEYDPGESAPAPKRRGRKPGPLSRTARESQRKLNHSRIEKARRTKINETLAALSNLVSEAEKQKSLATGIPQEPPAEKEKAKGEKEFKLDVLVKTVSYIQELIQKVEVLEIRANSSTCARCSQPPSSVSSPPSPGIKRKRAQAEHDEYDRGSIHSNASSRPSSLPPVGPPSSSTHKHSRRLTSASPALLPVSASPSLPPISSWLPHPYLDPSSFPSLPSPTPDFASRSVNPSSHLPTPPLSGSFRMPLSHPTQALPALSLPGPAHPSLASSSSFSQDRDTRKGMRIPMPPRRLSSASVNSTPTSTIPIMQKNVSQARGVSQSPTVSPSWTPEDESAASLLLQMSSSPTASSSGGSVGLVTPTMHRKSFGSGDRPGERADGGYGRERERFDVVKETRPLHAETPSSLLGIGRSKERV